MSGNGTDRVVDVLVRIEAGLGALEQATAKGFEKVNARLEKVNARLDKVVENTGSHSLRTVKARKRK